MMDESSPPTEPSGALVPPPSVPPTALATLPDPVPPRRPLRTRRWTESRGPLQELAGKLLAGAFDTLDSAGDAVAHALGIRDD